MKKKKPILWVIVAVATIGIVGGALSEESEPGSSKVQGSTPIVSTQKVETPNQTESHSKQPSEKISETPAKEVRYAASSKSDKYHKENCRYVESISEENIIFFYSEEEAIESGYIACGVCKP